MANFNTTGIEALELSLEEVADLPEEVLLTMLEAEAEIVAAAQRREIDALGLVETGQLRDSIAADRALRGRAGGRYITVGPRGARREGKESNGAVGFVTEYGAPKRGVKPRPWMRPAVEKCAEEAVEAARAVYEDYLRRKGL